MDDLAAALFEGGELLLGEQLQFDLPRNYGMVEEVSEIKFVLAD